MLKAVITREFSGGRGKVHINWDGTIIIQQGRPHGVMANPGECFLDVDDLQMMLDMLDEFKNTGNEILPKNVVRAL